MNQLIALVLISLIYSSGSINNNTLLLIISFDGFRYDYYTRNLSNTLVSLRENSSYAPYMLSVFPTKTFPNHFSIGTGLYAEVHGVLDNKVYEKSSNRNLNYSYELFHYNSDVVPLWDSQPTRYMRVCLSVQEVLELFASSFSSESPFTISDDANSGTLNERSGGGRRSGCMMWPGSNFVYQNTMPSHYQSWDKSVPWTDKVDTLLGWFNHPETPVNLGMLYFEEPDLSCHKSGPDSEEVNNQIKKLDDILRYLLDKAGSELLKRLNIVVLSDHGGQAVKIPDNMIVLEQFVNASWINRYGVPPNLQIYPIEGKYEEVLNALRAARSKKGGNFSTFTIEEMLDRWHYKHCDRTPPILLTADVGFLFSENKSYEAGTGYMGTHGYDPQEKNMRAFFMAYGPEFKRNFTIAPFENVNIYPMAAELLGLTLPLLRPNGTLAPLKGILVNYRAKEVGRPPTKLLITHEDSYTTKYFGFSLSLLCLVILIAYFVKQTKQRRQNITITSTSYRTLNQRPESERLIEMPEAASSDEAESQT